MEKGERVWVLGEVFAVREKVMNGGRSTGEYEDVYWFSADGGSGRRPIGQGDTMKPTHLIPESDLVPRAELDEALKHLRELMKPIDNGCYSIWPQSLRDTKDFIVKHAKPEALKAAGDMDLAHWEVKYVSPGTKTMILEKANLKPAPTLMLEQRLVAVEAKVAELTQTTNSRPNGPLAGRYTGATCPSCGLEHPLTVPCMAASHAVGHA